MPEKLYQRAWVLILMWLITGHCKKRSGSFPKMPAQARLIPINKLLSWQQVPVDNPIRLMKKELSGLTGAIGFESTAYHAILKENQNSITLETQLVSPHPSVGQSFKYGWQQMKKYFLPLFLLILVLIVAEIPAGLANYEVKDGFELEPVTPWHIIGTLYWFLVLPVFQYGVHYLNLKAARNQDFQVKEVLGGFSKYLDVVLANLLVLALVLLGLIVFIIPGIFILVRLAFVPYIVMDLDLGPVEAVQKSWKMTKGHGWTIFGMGLLSILIIIGGLLLVLVGVIFAVMWIFCSFASLYYAATSEQQEGKEITA